MRRQKANRRERRGGFGARLTLSTISPSAVILKSWICRENHLDRRTLHARFHTRERCGLRGIQGGGSIVIHESGYYVDGSGNLSIFLRQEEIRKRFPEFSPGRPYTLKCTVTLALGNGGPAGYWSDAFLREVFPQSERTHSISKKVRF